MTFEASGSTAGFNDGGTYNDGGPVPLAASLDPNAGGTSNDKTIWTLDQINANFNRSGYDWYTNNYGELNDGVLNYGFWLNQEELGNSYYTNVTGTVVSRQIDGVPHRGGISCAS